MSYSQVKAGKTLDLMARVTDEAGDKIVAADVSAAEYTIYVLDDSWTKGDPVEGHEAVTLTPSEVLFATYQTWTNDATGYDFKVQPSNVDYFPFPEATTSYLVEVTLTHATLGPIVLDFYVSTLRAIGGTSRLCTRGDVEELFGSENVAKWADVWSSGDQDLVSARIDWACEHASAFVYARIRRGPYAIPLTNVDPILTRVASQLAGVYLYDARGSQDVDAEAGAEKNVLTTHRKQAEKTISMIMLGRLAIDADEASASYPQVI